MDMMPLMGVLKSWETLASNSSLYISCICRDWTCDLRDFWFWLSKMMRFAGLYSQMISMISMSMGKASCRFLSAISSVHYSSFLLWRHS